jgi:hypothetical protein
MKTLKEYFSSEEQDNSLELTEGPAFDVGTLKSSGSVKDPLDPPAVLIMRRKSVRQFPNGQRVAMYYVDKINKYVTVPYTAMQWSGSVDEEVEYTDIIEQLRKIDERKCSGTVKHIDGTATKVRVETAENVLKIYESLTFNNKEEFKKILSESTEQFEEAASFVKKLK